MTWFKHQEWLWVTSVGVLHAGVAFNGEDSYNWWVGTMPATHDKADEYAIRQGNARPLAKAQEEAEHAIEAIVNEMVKILAAT